MKKDCFYSLSQMARSHGSLNIVLQVKLMSHLYLTSTFLSFANAYYVGLITFLIPITINTISKISDNYKSQIIIKLFEEKFKHYFFLFFLILNLTWGIILTFFPIGEIKNQVLSELVVYANLLYLLSFILSFCLLALNVSSLKKFTHGTDYILSTLDEQLKNLFEQKQTFKEADIEAKTKQFFDGIGSVILHELGNNDNIIQDYFKKFNESAKESNFFNHEKFLNNYLRQIDRLFKKSLKQKNQEVYLFCILMLSDILCFYAAQNTTKRLINHVFDELIKINLASFNNPDLNIFHYTLEFYKNIISNKYSLDNLETFDKYLLIIVKKIIEEDKRSIFNALLDHFINSRDTKYLTLYDDLFVPNVKRNEFYENKEIQQESNKLKNANKIFFKQDVDLWKKRFEELEIMCIENLNINLDEISQVNENAQNEKKRILDELGEICKDNNFKLMFMFVGALCVKKEKVDILFYYLLNYLSKMK